MAESVFERVAWKVAQEAAARGKLPSKVAKYLPSARKLLGGDIEGAVLDALGIVDAGGGSIGRPRIGGSLARPSPLLGGINLKKVREIFEKSAGTEYAKKNLWFLSITDLKNNGGELVDHNLFATDVSYAPLTVVGEAVAIGSGSFDKVTGTERVSMRISTLDDSAGSIKNWFKERHDRMCRQNGLFGLPVDYLFRVEVTHAVISGGDVSAYKDSFIMRAGTIEYELSRRDDALQELQMTFEQYDTFATLS